MVADTTTRNLAYVAMTRGREVNEVYLYERTMGEADHQHRDDQATEGVHVAHRGTPAQAARMLRHVVGRDERAKTAHQTAAGHPRRTVTPAGGRPGRPPPPTRPSPNGTPPSAKLNAHNAIKPWTVTVGSAGVAAVNATRATTSACNSGAVLF